jgi:3-methyladenine DNA glycosylase AlkC
MEERAMISPESSVEEVIAAILKRSGSCGLEDLVARLPARHWSEVFLAVDAMSRDGRLALRRIAKSGYQVSLPSSTLVGAEVQT